MLFVGPNNSGKSYLASVLWGLLNLPTNFFQDGDLATEAGRAGLSVVDRVIEKTLRGGEYALAAEDMQALVAFLNDTLRRRANALAEYVFNAAEVSLRRIAVEDFTAVGPGMVLVGRDERSAEEIHPLEKKLILGTLVRRALDGSERMRDLVSPSYRPGDAVFLPASRTGFMLFYKQVLESQLQGLWRTFRDRPEGLKLPTPGLHFLTLLATGLQPEPGPFAVEADFLERRALDGTLVMRPIGPSHDFEYRIGPDQTPLSLDLASSLVTELAPLVLVLRHIKQLPVLLFEEPEG
jgi:hypothetical protein